jgi:glyoxylate reductase
MPLKVFVTRHLTHDAEQKLDEFCVVEYWSEKTPPPYKVLLEKTQGIDGLVCLLSDPIDKKIIEEAKKLKVISQVAVGVDNIDLKAAAARNIAVGHTPDLLTNATADLAFTLMLAAARRLGEAIDYAKEGHWKTWELTNLLGVETNGAALGIIGMGRIGQAFAKRARGFDMKILYYNRSRVPSAESKLGASYFELDDLLRTADIISLHVPLNQESKGLIGAKQFEMMKREAILINTARGEVVDTNALVAALKNNQIAYAALDVTDPEPLPKSHPLYQMSNVIITPHIGSATKSARNAMALLAVDNLIAGLQNRPLPKAVVQPNI